jgi:hypothetical protein
MAAAAALAAYKKKAQEKKVREIIAEGGGSSSSESLERLLRFLEAPHLAAVLQKLRQTQVERSDPADQDKSPARARERGFVNKIAGRHIPVIHLRQVTVVLPCQSKPARSNCIKNQARGLPEEK